MSLARRVLDRRSERHLEQARITMRLDWARAEVEREFLAANVAGRWHPGAHGDIFLESTEVPTPAPPIGEARSERT